MSTQTDHLKRELRHVHEGPSLDEKPAGIGTVRFIVRCEGESWQVLAKAKTALVIVNQTAMGEWPADSAWSRLLPDWFVARCTPELSQEEAAAELSRRKSLSAEEQMQAERDGWSVLNWVYWFQPENRKWYWWDAEERDANTIIIAVEVEDWPFPWGSLAWLFRAAGATYVDTEV
jgi:hypothetical protein